MNQLARQANPYLQQHAENPVDWQPWGEQAFALARALDKPVLLSIGYSACHWCQVMAAESFANASIAALMNEYFVCVKVDRETRPDLDRIYQTAHLFLTRNSGGWPLTMFLTADRTPFFGGTYFPPQQRDGLPGFVDILERVRDYYLHHRQEIGAQNEALKEAMVRSEQSVKSAPGEVDQTPLLQVKGLLREQFDARYGGVGT
ncbi:MAG TPA: thioredoxin domain-containing protein, partial [Gammaproteobacteria bacterium]|nr:thioredoxin domain-containing protein [Gammaproteobacteria bacterium]